MPKRTTRNVYPYDSVKHGTLWRARYVSPSNRVVEKRGFLTKAEAEAWLTTEKSKLITGDWTDPRKATVTVGSLAPAWLEVKRRTLKPSAYKPLEATWRLHVAPRWEKVPLRCVVNGDIAAWLSEIDRSPSLPAIVVDALRPELSGRRPSTLVFPGRAGDYMRRVRASSGSKSWWKTALVTAGVETMVLHDPRHTAAAIAVNAGGNVKSVQRMLGHASAAMTLDRYADLFDDGLDRLIDQIDGAR